MKALKRQSTLRESFFILVIKVKMYWKFDTFAQDYKTFLSIKSCSYLGTFMSFYVQKYALLELSFELCL